MVERRVTPSRRSPNQPTKQGKSNAELSSPSVPSFSYGGEFKIKEEGTYRHPGDRHSVIEEGAIEIDRYHGEYGRHDHDPDLGTPNVPSLIE
jgi:hypothetical protein